ncbi:MAG: hypothetical protein ACWA5U_05825 [bacterium]
MKYTKYLKTLAFVGLIYSTNGALACDNKSCEKAYVAETQQYVDNQVRIADAAQQERIAYAKVREAREIAAYKAELIRAKYNQMIPTEETAAVSFTAFTLVSE